MNTLYVKFMTGSQIWKTLHFNITILSFDIQSFDAEHFNV
jgi:hypothetical protein